MADKNGKNIIVTGGNQGIGLAIVQRLLNDGYSVNMLARDRKKSEKSRNDLTDKGNLNIISLDLSRRDDIKNFIGNWKDDLYALVNNAGICKTERLDETSDVWDEVMDTNLSGMYFLTKGLIKKVEDNGRIINISSQLGKEGRAGYGAYCASKFAINGLTKCWAKELGGRGITVNSVCPGWVKTEMADIDLKRIAKEKGVDPDEFYKEICAPLELKRFTEPEEVANLVAWLVSPEASGVTGRDWLLNTIWNQE